jgi:flagellar motor component MotA
MLTFSKNRGRVKAGGLKMNKDIDKEVGVSRSGFVAEQAGKVIASAETFNGLMRKKVVKKLLGSKTLFFRHVLPEGMTRIMMGVDRDKEVSPPTSRTIAEAFMKSGLPFTVVKIEIDPKIEKAVRKYIGDIEKAHRRAAHSKLRFGAACPLTVG